MLVACCQCNGVVKIRIEWIYCESPLITVYADDWRAQVSIHDDPISGVLVNVHIVPTVVR
ncbi:hypothetical protein D3C81_1350340 [compost metagenome]